LLVCAALVTACQPRDELATYTGGTMGTTYHVTVTGPPGGASRDQVQACIDGTLREVNARLSTYAAGSEISRLNRSRSPDWIPISPMLHAVLVAAQRVNRESGGAFDVTVGPLVALWGFGADTQTPAPVVTPAIDALAAARRSAGHELLELRGGARPAVRKRVPMLTLDVNGIAPGFAVDRIAACLEQNGFANYLVELGGEVRGHGHRADGRPWQVAVEAPLAGERVAYAGLDLRDVAVSTSGDYRDFRMTTDGRRISHTIDPRTGRPVEHALASVTVVHTSATMADAYATAFMVLGTDAGHDLAVRLGLAALFLDRTDRPGRWHERSTPAFERLRRPAS
jgi:thiamine biosynthesis lipoprotein